MSMQELMRIMIVLLMWKHKATMLWEDPLARNWGQFPAILNKKCHFCYKNGEQVRKVPAQGLATVGGEGRGYRRSIWWRYCVHTYVNGKLRPVETIQGTGGGRIKENAWGGEFNYDIL
jgi:hypothetical protein